MNLNFNNSWENPGSKDRLELVFKDRFTGYGAYRLRLQYVRNKLLAMFITFGLFTGAAALPLILAKKDRPKIILHSHYRPPVDTIISWIPVPDEPTSSSGGSKANNNASSQWTGTIDPRALNPLPLPPTANPGAGGEEGIDPGNPFEGNGGTGIGNGTSNQGIDTVIIKNFRLDRSKPPIFPGGIEELTKYIQENYRNPAECNDIGSEGSVDLKFVVNKDGSLTWITAERSSVECPAFAAEIIRIMKSSPSWVAAQNAEGHFVRSWVSIKVRLRLE